MRTGAIFARGSCRALKWMALLGIVFTLGASQAAAQPTVAADGAKYVGAVITVSVTDTANAGVAHRVTGTPDASDFVLATGSTAARSVSVSGSEITLTFASAATVTGGGDLTYTQNVDTRKQITSVATGVALATFTVTPAEANTVPQFTAAGPALEAKLNEAIATGLALPRASGGNGALTYAVTETLPAGLTLTDPVSATVGPTITGTPTALTNGAEPFTLSVTDTATAGGEGPETSSVRFTIAVYDKPVAPAMPTVVPTPNVSGSLEVTWTAPVDNNSVILYYEVQHKETAATAWVVPNTRVQDGTSHTVSGLTNGTSYDFQVRAINAAGASGYSATGMGTPMASGAVPDMPTGLRVTMTPNTRGSLTASWTAPSGNGKPVTGYDVEYHMQGGDASSRQVTDTSTVIGDLRDNTAYMVRVRANNDNGSSAWTAYVSGTTAPAPPPPSTTRGEITKFAIEGAEERDIGGKRMHLDEGEHTKVSVTIEWTDDQLEELWDGIPSGSKPPDALVQIGARPVSNNPRWLSPAEIDHDVNIGPNFFVRVAIPKVPKTDRSDDSTGSTQFTVGQDDDAEAEAFELYVRNTDDFHQSRSSFTSGVFVIEDKQTQGITLSRKGSGAVYEGGDNVVFEIAAKPARVQLTLEVRLDLEDISDESIATRDNRTDVSVVTIQPGPDEKETVTVTLDKNDGNRRNNMLRMEAEVIPYALDTGAYEGITSQMEDFEVIDVHKLPELMVSQSMDTVEEGGEVELELVLDRNPADTRRIDPETREHTSEPVQVMLSPGMGTTASMDDYQLPVTVEFEEFKSYKDNSNSWLQKKMVKVMVHEDDDIEGGELLVIDAMVSGTKTENGTEKDPYPGVSSLTIDEATGKLVWALTPEEIEEALAAAKMKAAGDDMVFTEGEMIELAGNDLFGRAEGVTVGYDVKLDGSSVSDSVSGGMIALTAEDTGMTKVTVTARASRPGGLMIANQTDPREARITFPVEVGLVALTIMLSGPEDMNIVEGGMPHANGTMGTAMVTATANREVTEDVTVTLMHHRSMSSAMADEYMAEPIVIEAGMMKGSTMVTAVEDGMTEDMEELVLYGMAADNAGEVTGEIKLYIWDVAVPALPIVAQLLLGGLLAVVGGYRRYRRR